MARAILHVDMDAFFAAVEERDEEALRSRPLVIGADPRGGRGRGVVSTANYEARRYGIRSAMPISEAYHRCPHAVFRRPRMTAYARASKRVFAIFDRFTDLVEPLGIDEAFLDVTASRRLFGTGPEIAAALKQAIRAEERLTASVGVATSKYVAKVASDLEKPDGLVVVPPGAEGAFLAPLPLERLWGAGPRARGRLASLGCRTIGDVAALDRCVLRDGLGDALGDRFYRLSQGVDARPVVRDGRRKSLGKEITFDRDVEDRDRVERTLLRLCEGAARALRRRGLCARTITLKLRWEGFETLTRGRTLPRPVRTVERIWPVARDLFRAADGGRRRIRLVGVSLSGLAPSGAGQMSLFEEGAEPDDRIADVTDRLREKYGTGAVTRARLLEKP
ncbi:MAG: DNA polymerase IV [Gemmatimonadota bacterium]